jgi:Flp pilus assembly protein TadG
MPRRSMPRRSRLRSDRGSSVVEFVLLAVLLVLLLFVVLQIAVWFYARTIVASAAADAARYAATTRGGHGTGAERAGELIDDGLSVTAANQIPCTDSTSVDAASGLPTTTVHCRGQLKMVLLPFDIPLTIDVNSTSFTEGSP